MIWGVGIDLVEVRRIKQLVERYGERFLRRVFNEEELLYASRKASPEASLAASFAAKEAFSKALGTGFSGIALKEVWVRREENGRPVLRFSGQALRLTEDLGLVTRLSLSHEAGIAAAVVILEKEVRK